MELSKHDTQRAKGLAILGMLMLHLFCRLDNLPYTPCLYIGQTPLIYYFGLFGDICVPIYCFCSGYAHYLLKEQQGTDYNRNIPNKLLRFLCNYWEILVVFSIVGLVSGKGLILPGSFGEFAGNFLLYRISYNGAWWFVITYLFLSILSPILITIAKRMHWIFVLLLSSIVYFLAYLFRFKFIFAVPNVIFDWFWQQLILLGTSQFGYVIGLLCKKEGWVTKLRQNVQKQGEEVRLPLKKHITRAVVCLLPIAAFVGHCIFQSLIVAPFTATAVLAFLFAIKLPNFVDASLLFLGKHSTNIWFTHMFFYLTLFEGLVFVARYPVLVLAIMLVITVIVSYLIQYLDKFLLVLRKRMFKA